MWLRSLTFDVHMWLQIGHGVALDISVVFAALLRRSHTSAMVRLRSLSKFAAVLMTIARHPDLSAPALSNSFGSRPAHFRYDVRLSLYFFLGRPCLCFPRAAQLVIKKLARDS